LRLDSFVFEQAESSLINVVFDFLQLLRGQLDPLFFQVLATSPLDDDFSNTTGNLQWLSDGHKFILEHYSLPKFLKPFDLGFRETGKIPPSCICWLFSSACSFLRWTSQNTR